MKATIKFDCKNCINDIELSITIKGKDLPFLKDIKEEAKKQGWHIGRDCYCLSCFQALPAHCDTCEHYEGNKSMGAPICRRDGKFAAPFDYCKHHQHFHGYKNPVPTLDDKNKE